MSYGKKFQGMGTFDEVVNGSKPKPQPGHIYCYECGAGFNPNDSKINGVRVAPSAHCTSCQQANFKAGRWQEIFRLEAATAKENA